MTTASDSTGCVFCEIVAGRSPASVFHEDDLTLGFMSIGPINEGHALVIPKRHATGLSDLDPEHGRRMWDATHRTAAAVRNSGVRCEGVNLFLADGRAAFQEVFHVHMHILPRYPGDAFGLAIAPTPPPDRSQLDDIAARIRSKL